MHPKSTRVFNTTVREVPLAQGHRLAQTPSKMRSSIRLLRAISDTCQCAALPKVDVQCQTADGIHGTFHITWAD